MLEVPFKGSGLLKKPTDCYEEILPHSVLWVRKKNLFLLINKNDDAYKEGFKIFA